VAEGGEETYVKGVIGGLLELAITRRVADLSAKMGRLDQNEQADQWADLLSQIQDLTARRALLREE
jgi:hypothetical protein